MTTVLAQVTKTDRTPELIKSLSALNAQFALTPVHCKAPYLNKWQSIDTSRDDIASHITSGKADGYGIKLGIPSGGVCAIDIDGTAARCRLIDVMGDDEMPLTVEFASGKTDRSQYLFSIPPQLWDSLISKSDKIPNGDASEEFGFFWSGRQSVLPPSAHPETDGYYWVHSPDTTPIAQIPDRLLEYWLNLITPPRQESSHKPQPKPSKTSPKQGTNTDYSIPIARLLTSDHRSILGGVGEPGRNNTGASLARDLIGVAALGHIETDYNYKLYKLTIADNAEDLFYSYCDGCSPPLTNKEGAKIWASAQKSDHMPSIQDEGALKNCARKYLKETVPRDPDVPGCGSHGANEDKIEIDKIEIDKILTAKRHRLSPHDILPESIANKIQQISNARGVNCEPLILGHLVAVSSVPHANTRLRIGNYGDVLSVYPNLFGMAVGDSGSLKSPTIGTGFTKPLRALQTTYIKRYESEITDYKAKLKTWESADKKSREDEPEPPRLVVVVAEDATMEKIEDLAYHQSNICPAIYRDELIGIFQAFDKHGGKGANDSRAKLLSYYDGSPINIHRVGTGSKISTHDYHPVVFGGIQPEVLKGLAHSIGMDNDGTLCRFLYAPINRTYKPWDTDPDTDRIDTDTFNTLIEKVHNLPAIECSLDHAGQRAWAEIVNYYNRECLTNSQLSQWLKHAYSKTIGQLGKIALTLHLIECASTDRISGIISAATINRAAIALDYFISQAIALVASTEESLESHLVKILAKAVEMGSITPRGVSRCFSSKQRPSAGTARSYLEQLASGGYGTFSEGIFTPSTAVPVDVTTCPRMSPTLGHDEPSISKGFNDNVTNVTTFYQSNIIQLDMKIDDDNHPLKASNLYPSTELVTLVTSTPVNQSGSSVEGVPELVTSAGTLVTLVTKAGSLVPTDGVEALIPAGSVVTTDEVEAGISAGSAVTSDEVEAVIPAGSVVTTDEVEAVIPAGSLVTNTGSVVPAPLKVGDRVLIPNCGKLATIERIDHQLDNVLCALTLDDGTTKSVLLEYLEVV